jgi:hypothetical protein
MSFSLFRDITDMILAPTPDGEVTEPHPEPFLPTPAQLRAAILAVPTTAPRRIVLPPPVFVERAESVPQRSGIVSKALLGAVLGAAVAIWTAAWGPAWMAWCAVLAPMTFAAGLALAAQAVADRSPFARPAAVGVFCAIGFFHGLALCAPFL